MPSSVSGGGIVVYVGILNDHGYSRRPYPKWPLRVSPHVALCDGFLRRLSVRATTSTDSRACTRAHNFFSAWCSAERTIRSIRPSASGSIRSP